MSTFDWCAHGDHENCIRETERFYFGPKTKKDKIGLVMTGEIDKCECDKRGCPCYVKPADRNKVKKRRRK